MTITILPYSPHWPVQFAEIARSLRDALGGLALRIDHIGSTAVPGLPAKEILDLQITVQALDAAVETVLQRAGYNRLPHITCDHVPPGGSDDSQDWEKWFFQPATTPPAINLHVRVLGRANQRYPLLFRDYLRAHPLVAAAYAQTKFALMRYHADDLTAYCDIKDPVCDVIIAAAEAWAVAIDWQPSPTEG